MTGIAEILLLWQKTNFFGPIIDDLFSIWLHFDSTLW